MLTYELKKAPGVPLYEALYRCIRADILSGALAPGEKLPSKRALADNLEVSKITVEGAYNQLLSEGYICSREKVGYFVENLERQAVAPLPDPKPETPPAPPAVDLTGGPVSFPFSVWTKLQREVVLDYGEQLLSAMPNLGVYELRQAISRHLADFRGLHARPENILIGAGTDFLYNILIQLLGRDKTYAVEEPGYDKIRKIYAAGGVACIGADMDSEGVRLGSLGSARVLHISASHHFPTGVVTSLTRRMELLAWAELRDGYIIEDDYDSEFRFDAHPVPTMQSMDRSGRCIYMNSFSKSLSPAFRISYMVLPDNLMRRFQEQLGFYSCTVPSFEQYTLARFISRGHFEKHINRMRKFYRARRNRVIQILENCPFADKLEILEQDAGLHFLLKVDTQLPDQVLTLLLQEVGIRIHALSRYYHRAYPLDTHCLVVNYAGVNEEALDAVLKLMGERR